MIRITNNIFINEDDIEIKFIRSPGPGGQHVNKVESAVQIKFNAKECNSIPEDMFERLKRIAGQKITSDGVIVISSNNTRSQLRNKENAFERLVGILRDASIKPKKRRITKPSKASKRRRIENKKKRGETKKLRSKKIRE